MFLKADRSPLTFEDAMSIHLYKAMRRGPVEMIGRFGNYPRFIKDVIAGRLYSSSWAVALEKFTHGDYWHHEIAGMIADSGYMRILSALTASAPPSPRCAANQLYISKFHDAAALL